MDTHGNGDNEEMDTLPLPKPKMDEGDLDPVSCKSTLLELTCIVL